MKSHPIKAITAVLAVLTMLASSVQAAETESVLESSDQQFVKAASQLGMGEVQIAALGVKKGASADVKALAEKMVTDHTASNTELSALAKTKKVQASVVTDPDHTEILKDLENTDTGVDFDKAFLDQMESMHKKSIALFEDAAEDSKDAEVKAWAAKTLPTLRNHLEHVQAAMKK